MTHQTTVIGGSAAGFYTAYLMAKGGAKVELYEAAEALEPPPRTLIVTSRLRDEVGPLAEGVVLNEIRRFELCANGSKAVVPLRRPDLVIERGRLIRDLAAQAAAAGCRTHLGWRFEGVEPNGHGLHLAMRRNGSVETVWTESLIGADGARSKVAQAAGWPAPTTVPLIQATVKLPRDLSPDTTRVWFVPEDTPYFYWLIPESASRGVLGLIAEDGRQGREALTAFLAKHRLEPLDFQAARIPIYTPISARRRIGNGDVYLVGDAAGHVKASTVGGIVTGFRGALGVAEAVLHGSSERLERLHRELDRHLWIRRLLHRFSQQDYERLLKLALSCGQVLAAHTRDEPATLLRKACLAQPRLVLLGARAMLRSWGLG